MENNKMDSVNFGATETRESNRVYINLRTGKLSETSKEQKSGFKPFTTKNASGQEYHFFAKTYDDLTCYIKDVVWHEFEYEGKKIVGWNVVLDTGEKEYVLQINSNDRPYQTIMSVLPNVDFSCPVRVVAFMGKSSAGKNQKVLLFTQNMDKTAKEWVKPKYEAKWMSRLLSGKLKDIVSLKDDGAIQEALGMLHENEYRNVALDADGMPDPNFPYIREKSDGTWSMDAWTEFLKERFETETIPEIKAAANIRGVWFQKKETAENGAVLSDDYEDLPDFSGSETATDDDIPF
jgi:hypothetical protein